MNTETAQVDDLRLVTLPSAVSCTELFVRFTLTEWSLRALIDDAAQAATHLVRTAVDHADQQSPGFLSVRMRLHGDCLLIEIDQDQVLQSPDVPTTLAGGQAGVSSQQGRGTLMWCELPLPSGISAAEVPLPHREPRKSSAAEQPSADDITELDPQVMQRILSGLSQSSLDEPSR